MKLIISRGQHDIKGMLGGHKGVNFSLKCRLELTGEEAGLVQKYKLDFYPLTLREFQGTTMPGISISALVTGHTSVVSDVTKLVREENIIKNACDELPTLFDVCRSFGGDEVVAYPRKSSESEE
jgi:hypothetical protein